MKIKNAFVFAFAAFLLASCADADYDCNMAETKVYGELRADFGAMAESPSALAIEIYSHSEDKTVRSWSTLDEIPAAVFLPLGDYTVTVKNGEEMPLVSDEPYYNATDDFTITGSRVTDFSMTCPLLNMKLSIFVDGELAALYPGWEVMIIDMNDLSVIESMDETTLRTLYLTPMLFGVEFTDGTESISFQVFDEYEAGMHHNISIE